MPSAIPRPRPLPIRITLLATALTALLAAPGASAAPTAKRVVKTTANATLGKTILTNNRGHTLYSLSAETGGRFICVGDCLASWKPLVVPEGVKPRGPVKLRTRLRPDGRTQVTYKGLPLYSFNGDIAPGKVEGEGLRDVGTWHAATVPTAAAPQPEPEPTPPPPYPNPYGY